MTSLQRAVLNRIQSDFPLKPRPYTVLARALEASPDEIRDAVAACRAAGIIRRIGGSFSAAQLGYVSALVAVRVEPSKLESVARHAAQFDEVTHDYERGNPVNLWFTVVAETPARMAAITDSVRSRPGVGDLHVLPAIRTFKLRVNFDMSVTADAGGTDRGEQVGATHGESASPRSGGANSVRTCPPLGDDDRRLIARCCDDISGSEAPFADLAGELGLSEMAVLARLTRYRNEGLMRRFGAMVQHQRAGFIANAMGVWDVPDVDVDRVGSLLSRSQAVSHCYERPRFAGWPYNLYGMIHGRSAADCHREQEELTRLSGITESRLLFTGREFKKSSVRYFVQHWPKT